MKVGVDVDGTLITYGSKPNYRVIQLFFLLQGMGCDMIIWSGGGVDYAEQWRDKLGLNATVLPKGSIEVDLAIDDELATSLGKVLLQVQHPTPCQDCNTLDGVFKTDCPRQERQGNKVEAYLCDSCYDTRRVLL